jgi:hypothetical protein
MGGNHDIVLPCFTHINHYFYIDYLYTSCQVGNTISMARCIRPLPGTPVYHAARCRIDQWRNHLSTNWPFSMRFNTLHSWLVDIKQRNHVYIHIYMYTHSTILHMMYICTICIIFYQYDSICIYTASFLSYVWQSNHARIKPTCHIDWDPRAGERWPHVAT